MITTVPSGGAPGLTPVLSEPGHDTVIAVTLHVFVQSLAQHSAGAEVDLSHHGPLLEFCELAVSSVVKVNLGLTKPAPSS